MAAFFPPLENKVNKTNRGEHLQCKFLEAEGGGATWALKFKSSLHSETPTQGKNPSINKLIESKRRL